MTARASTPEFSCSSCRALVLHASCSAELASCPVCSSCFRIVCSACELLGLCPSCARQLWTPPAEADDDERAVLA